jgi:hypothetical protein
LADKIGYGKTASTIGLIDATLQRLDPPIAKWDSDCFIPTNATLILVPPNLLEQWLGEISKFTGDGSLVKQKMERGWIRKTSYDGSFDVFACTNVSPLKGVSVEELKKADVVICTYRLLFSEIYKKRLRVLCSPEHRLSAVSRAAIQSDTNVVQLDSMPIGRAQGSITVLREVTRQLLKGERAIAMQHNGWANVRPDKQAYY